MREGFLRKIEQRALVCDGAMGTMLYAKGISLHRCFDELNLSQPQLVKEVHLGYVKAGARLAREVAGSLGPLGVRLEPLGPTSLAEARPASEEAGERLGTETLKD